MSQVMEDTSLFKIKNYSVHPIHKNYWVFYFSNDQMALTFEELLNTNNIEFEKDIGEDLVKRTLFGIHQKHTSEAMRLNNIAIGKHRHPFIKDPILRYAVIIISIGLIALAIIGYLQSNG